MTVSQEKSCSDLLDCCCSVGVEGIISPSNFDRMNHFWRCAFLGGVGDFFSFNFCAVLMGIRCSHGVRKYQPKPVGKNGCFILPL